MTPELIAAAAIEAAAEREIGQPRGALSGVGKIAVEAIAGVEMVIVPAARMAQLLELERAMRGPVAAIADERQRQIERERWTTEHDDEHRDGSMAAVAACYAFLASTEADMPPTPRSCVSIVHLMWPRSWSWQWWKPKNPRRDLVRAGALIVAEIERLDRADLARRAPSDG
jgi:hypothetical protein